MNLSKSQYMRGMQCHKSLWLYKNRPEFREVPDESQDTLFDKGYDVGELAKGLFPNGIEVAYDTENFKAMLTKTQELIDNGIEVIYEATFSENGLFVRVDILVKKGDAWDIYEVKGSTGARDKHGVLENKYLHDVAIQWYVLSGKMKLNRAFLVHLDNTYVRRGDLEVEKLFAMDDITEEVMGEQEYYIDAKLFEMESILRGEIPGIEIGKQCDKPYHCDFSSHCWQHIPKKDSVFDISYANGKQWKLYEQGIVSIDDIPDNFPMGSKATEQIKHHRSQKIKIDEPKIKAFLEGIEYPINFFDFETFQDPIPRFDNQRPYAQMPFQYSLHILHEDGRLEHKEFLGDENSDPRRALAEQMLSEITETGSIVAYHDSFEKTQIKELANLFDDLRDELLALIERFADLEVPFRSRDYYDPAFHGRSSIKVVLPALFPNDPELDYKKLGSVQNGSDAMDIFPKLHLLTDENRKEEIRNDLLAYCRLDTLAMVKIWEKLHQLIKE